ncbi:uncharacterized protein [Littorina saxatilis]|uniref:Uncharacterized protein n=1 Tax=Littorina saxatilis TaxID=31220 RepID=A0AAN9GFZ4_9CAEN
MSTIRDVVILAVFSGVVGLCSIAFSQCGPNSVSALHTTSLEHEGVINRFPGFFRDDIEEEVFEWEYNNVPDQANLPDDDRCAKTSHFCNNSQVPYCKTDNKHYYTHNGCCRSHTVFKHYYKLPLAVPGHNADVEVAQFVNYKQYFSIQECCQWADCERECTCKQIDYVVTAIVKMNGRYSGEWVRVPGSCLCINY